MSTCILRQLTTTRQLQLPPPAHIPVCSHRQQLLSAAAVSAATDATVIHSTASILVVRSRHLLPPSAVAVSRRCLCRRCHRYPQRCRHCRPKSSSVATIISRCQPLLPSPPPMFSTAPQPLFSSVAAASGRRQPLVVYHKKR